MNDFIKIYQIEDYEHLNWQLLNLIDQQLIDYGLANDNYYPSQGGKYISDFYIDPNRRGTRYKHLITKTVIPFINDYAHFFGSKVYSDFTNQWWFQQYSEGERHGWHDHSSGKGGTAISAVYYAELPNPKEATEFATYRDLDLKEGSFIVYPSFLPHRAPRIESNKRKTIFAVNVFLTADREYLKSTYPDR